MELQTVCLADVAVNLDATEKRVDQWGELMLRADELLTHGLSGSKLEEGLMQFVRMRGWPEKLRGTVRQVVRQAEHKKLKADAEARRLAAVEELQVVSLAKVQPKAVRWLWPGKIPLGTVTVIYGEAGMGKTCLALDLAARVSKGDVLADGAAGPGAGQVLILNGEDHVDEKIVPRLMGGGADLQNVTAMKWIKVGVLEGQSRQRRFDLGYDLPALWEEIETLPDARLLIIDSLEAFCGRRGLGRAAMRAVLGQLEDLAVQCGIAIVVLTAGAKCDLPVKNVWRVDCDALDSGLKTFVPVRFDCGALPAGLAFRITADKIVWETQLESPTADRSRGATAQQEKSCQLKQHAEWLKSCLAEGPLPAKEVLTAASQAGWSAGQMRRAKDALGVVCSKETSANGQWVWELPAPVGERVELEKVESRPAVRFEDVEGVEDAGKMLGAA